MSFYRRNYQIRAASFGFCYKANTVSALIGAWQNSWQSDTKKGEIYRNNLIQLVLENRQIATYHGRALAHLNKW